MEKLTIAEASEIVQVGRDKIRYGSKLLGIKLIKQGRVSYIPTSSITLLQAMYHSVATGLSPSLAAKEVLSTYATMPEPQQVISKEVSNDVLIDRIGSLEAAVMLLVNENKSLKTQNTTILSKLNTLSINLLPARQSIAFKAWQPPIKQPVKVSFVKRLWLELFNPESLRTTS